MSKLTSNIYSQRPSNVPKNKLGIVVWSKPSLHGKGVNKIENGKRILSNNSGSVYLRG